MSDEINLAIVDQELYRKIKAIFETNQNWIAQSNAIETMMIEAVCDQYQLIQITRALVLALAVAQGQRHADMVLRLGNQLDDKAKMLESLALAEGE